MTKDNCHFKFKYISHRHLIYIFILLILFPIANFSDAKNKPIFHRLLDGGDDSSEPRDIIIDNIPAIEIHGERLPRYEPPACFLEL